MSFYFVFSVVDLIKDINKLKYALLNNWDNYCKKNIKKNCEIELNNDIKNYINQFNFSIIEHIPIQKIIDEHIKTIYGKIRFGGISIQSPKNISPPERIEKQELPYITALLESYSEYAKVSFSDVSTLQSNTNLHKDLQYQRKYFYSAETIRRFVRDTFTNEDDFQCLENEIYEGIKEIHEEDYENGYKRLKKDLAQASVVNTSKSLLGSKLAFIGISEKKGICHMLVEDRNISWVKKYE
ncbi:MAG: ABC-three component system protein [Treponema sp.]